MADKDRLQEVVDKVIEVLAEVVKSQKILFPRELRDKIDKAWKELYELRSGINESTVVDEIKSNISQAKDADLKRAGMNGNQLELKMFGYLEAYNEREEKGGLRRLKRFFKYAKTILESLGSVVPGVGIIKEFIDAVEMGIEKAEET